MTLQGSREQEEEAVVGGEGKGEREKEREEARHWIKTKKKAEEQGAGVRGIILKG